MAITCHNKHTHHIDNLRNDKNRSSEATGISGKPGYEPGLDY